MTSARKNSDSEICVRSMTGFGKACAEGEGLQIDVEVRTVNSRFLDVVTRLPRLYTPFEFKLREQISEVLDRGRVEVYVARNSQETRSEEVKLHRGVYDAFVTLYEGLLEEKKLLNEQSRADMVRDVLGRREVLEHDETLGDSDVELSLLRKALSEALDAVCILRDREGEKLGSDLVSRINGLQQSAEEIAEKVKKNPERMREKILDRMKKFSSEITLDEARLAQEVVFLVDRADVTEELVRLKSHVKQFRKILCVAPNGRKLDFMIQEIGREVNTISSKAQDADVQQLVVEAKSELEKMKEQVQNIE